MSVPASSAAAPGVSTTPAHLRRERSLPIRPGAPTERFGAAGNDGRNRGPGVRMGGGERARGRCDGLARYLEPMSGDAPARSAGAGRLRGRAGRRKPGMVEGRAAP